MARVWTCNNAFSLDSSGSLYVIWLFHQGEWEQFQLCALNVQPDQQVIDVLDLYYFISLLGTR